MEEYKCGEHPNPDKASSSLVAAVASFQRGAGLSKH